LDRQNNYVENKHTAYISNTAKSFDIPATSINPT